MASQYDVLSHAWPAKDIIYVAIIGSVMLAYMLEWLLWLAAFLYCFCKVFQKAHNSRTKVLAVSMMTLFTLIRLMFLPTMVAILPLPYEITRFFPPKFVSSFQWIAFWCFSTSLTVPWLLCIYQLITHHFSRIRSNDHMLHEDVAPKIVIIMPCYREVPDVLLRTVDSLVDCDYPSACIHIFLSFDREQEDRLYLRTIEKLGVPHLARSGYPKSMDIGYRDTRITVSRFPHGGKRYCQKQTFSLIQEVYSDYVRQDENMFVLFIDSDCILDKDCIKNMISEMCLPRAGPREMLAMTGIITATTERNSLITVLQDIEYIHGQLFERSVESCCGAVTCLPGALTIVRFAAFQRMAEVYFADKTEQCEDLFDYGKCHLGEDRWLTHLFMVAATGNYQISMNTSAFCKTEAVQTFSGLLKQRRRWFLGSVTNEVCMLTDTRIWRKFPFLCIFRLAQNTVRTTALLFFILVISLLTTSRRVEQLPVAFLGVSLGLNWLLMLYFGATLGRYKIMLYPLMFVLSPFLNWIYMVYGIFTAGKRTWGGPRADAGRADLKITSRSVAEHAKAVGDDLNIVPETFRPSSEARKQLPGYDFTKASMFVASAV